MSQTAPATDRPAGSTAPRRRWLADAIISGFIATGASTAVLVVAFAIANGAGSSTGNALQYALWQLSHNDVVSQSRAAPAAALVAHVLLGLFWAIVYARLAEPRLSGPGWRRGMIFSILPWLVSIVILLPAALFGRLETALSAGPLPPLGNLILHLIYGYTLGQLYDAGADRPAVSEDLEYDEPLELPAVEHSEALGAAGIVAGAIVGAFIGVALSVLLPPVLPAVDLSGWQVALAGAGLLAGGAVGGVVGSFAGLPSAPEAYEPEHELGPDPFDRGVLPFLLPAATVLVIATIITTLGETLLQFGKVPVPIGPVTIAGSVLAALAGIVVIMAGALFLARPQSGEPPSSRETVSHREH